MIKRELWSWSVFLNRWLMLSREEDNRMSLLLEISMFLFVLFDEIEPA